MKSLRRFELCAALLLALASPSAAQDAPQDTEGERETVMLRLRDGGILWGSFEAHDPASVSFRRLDTGGLAVLPFRLIDPAQARELELAWGYADVSNQELLIDAERIPLVDGKEVVGLVVHRSDDALHVKTAESLYVLPKARIAGPATQVQVPALDVYTRGELYQMKAGEYAVELAATGEAGAAANWTMAQHCERTLDFAHAVQHYRAAAAADPTYRAADLPAMLARAEVKAAAQAEVDALGEIDLERKREHFDAALALVDTFSSRFPKTALLPDLARLKDRVLKSQDRALRDRILSSWYYHAGRLARAAAAKLTLAEAVEYAGEKMTEEVLAKVAADLDRLQHDIPLERARALWKERKTYRVHKASYGMGTWLLGEERARAGLEEEPTEEDKVKTEKDELRSKLEEALKKYLQNQEVARKASQGGGADQKPEDDPETFWKVMGGGARSQWVLAYYAEFSGDMEIRGFRAENCSECAGTGMLETLYLGSTSENKGSAASVLEPCPVCRHVGVIRRIVYR